MDYSAEIERLRTEQAKFITLVASLDEKVLHGGMTDYERSFIINSITHGLAAKDYIAKIDRDIAAIRQQLEEERHRRRLRGASIVSLATIAFFAIAVMIIYPGITGRITYNEDSYSLINISKSYDVGTYYYNISIAGSSISSLKLAGSYYGNFTIRIEDSSGRVLGFYRPSASNEFTGMVVAQENLSAATIPDDGNEGVVVDGINTTDNATSDDLATDNMAIDDITIGNMTVDDIDNMTTNNLSIDNITMIDNITTSGDVLDDNASTDNLTGDAHNSTYSSMNDSNDSSSAPIVTPQSPQIRAPEGTDVNAANALVPISFSYDCLECTDAFPALLVIDVSQGSLYLANIQYSLRSKPLNQTRLIEDMTVSGNASINLSDYFAGAYTYDSSSVEGVNITVSGDILSIYGNDARNVTAFVYALSRTEMIRSNSFAIHVIDSHAIYGNLTHNSSISNDSMLSKKGHARIDKKIAARISQDRYARVIVKYGDDVLAGAAFGHRPYASVDVDAAALDSLGSDPAIEAVYLDQPVRLLMQDSIALTRIDGMKDYAIQNGATLDGNGVSICMLDSGVDPSVVKSFDHGYDFVNNDSEPIDDNGHGTQVGYIISSIAPASRLIVAKVVNSSGMGYESDILAGLDYCEAQGAGIISISLGAGSYSGYCDDDIVGQRVYDLSQKGILVVAASGNDGKDALTIPACSSGALAVGASTKSDTLWKYTNYDSALMLLAPGTNISTLGINSSPSVASGTSMSVPFVSATAALLLQHNSSLYSGTLKSLLINSGDIINASSREFTRLDAYNAITGNLTNSLVPTANVSNGTSGIYVTAYGYGHSCSLDSDCDGPCLYCGGSVTLTCMYVSAGSDTRNACNGGYTCSGQSIIDGGSCQGTSNACGYNRTTCAGNCDSWCVTGNGTCYDTAAMQDPYNICEGTNNVDWQCGGIGGQQAINMAVCSASTTCGAGHSPCAGDCNSECVTGQEFCQDTPAGTDPYNLCTASGWDGCSGTCTKTASNTGVCGSGTACGTNSTYVGEQKVCSGGNEVSPNTSLYCDIDLQDCIPGNCQAQLWYRGCNAAGACTISDVAAFGVLVNATSGYVLDSNSTTCTLNAAGGCDSSQHCTGETFYDYHACNGAGSCTVDASSHDKDSASSYCTSAATGCTPRTWISGGTTISGNTPNCCGDDGGADQFYMLWSPSSATANNCTRCNSGSYVAGTMVYGNGNYTGSLTTGMNNLTCYYGAYSCAYNSAANGASVLICGNGYFSSSNSACTAAVPTSAIQGYCYTGDMQCNSTNGYRGTVSNLLCGNGYLSNSNSQCNYVNPSGALGGYCYTGDISCADGSSSSSSSTLIYGNGNYTGSLTTGTNNLTCYYGPLTCAENSALSGASASICGNGYFSSSNSACTAADKLSVTSGYCYTGDMQCNTTNGYKGSVSGVLYGNGYWTGTTCYYGDISCADGSSGNGASGTTLCSASSATCCSDQMNITEGVSCGNGVFNAGTISDRDTSQARCQSTASGCAAQSWMVNAPYSGSQCCGNDGAADNSYYNSSNPTTATSMTCERCNAGSYVAPTTLCGNGYFSSASGSCSSADKTTATSGYCAYNDITCNAATGSNGAFSPILYGNGYTTGNTATSTSLVCFYGDISCADGSYANGTSGTYCGNGYFSSSNTTCSAASNTTATSGYCYYNDITCNNGAAASSAVSGLLYGNGYWTGTTCYYGDISCGENYYNSTTSTGTTLCSQSQGATCCNATGIIEGVSCGDGTFGAGTLYDRDTSQARCTSSSPGCTPYAWNIGGEINATVCCGDDAGENIKSKVCSGSVCTTNSSDDACCSASNDCVASSTCYATGATFNVGGDAALDYCNAGTWVDCNTNNECDATYYCSANSCILSTISITFQGQTPAAGSRQIANSVTYNVTVTSTGANVNSCIAQVNNVNYSMTMVGSGTTVSCYLTQATSDGTTYNFMVFANNSVGLMGNTSSRSFIENSKPSISSVTVTPASPTTSDDLTCTVSGWSDANGDSQQYYYNWYNGTVLKFTTLSASTTNVLGHLNTSKGQSWNCSVTPWDGYENGTSLGAAKTIANSAPTAPTGMTFTDPIYVGNVLTASASGSTDVDGDTITYYYEFYNVNSSSVVRAYSSTATYTVQASDAHDLIRVRVNASDGTAYSALYEANTTIDNSAPALSSITAAPSCIKGGTVTVTSVGASDADSDNLILRAGSSSGGMQLCNSTSGTPQRSCTFTVQNFWTDTASHTIYGTMSDGANASAEKTATISTDNTVPGTPSPSASPTGWTTQAYCTISYAAVADAGCGNSSINYEYAVDGGAWTSVGANTTFNTSTLTGNVNHTITVRAYDSVRNNGTAGTTYCAVDSTAPTVGIPALYNGTRTGSASGSYFKGTVGIASSVTDNILLDLTTCQVSINSAAWTATGVTNNGTHCLYASYSTASSFNISFRANDSADNIGTSGLSNFTYDATPPSGGSVAYFNGNTSNSSTTVSFSTGTDSGSGINSGTAALQSRSAAFSSGSCGSYGSWSTVYTGTTSPQTASLSNGNCYQYQYQVDDNLGNEVNYTSSNVIIADSTLPAITLVSPTDDNNSYVPRNWTYVNVTVSESASACSLNWSGTLSAMSGSATNWYINKSAADGQYNYSVRCNDTANNFNNSEMRLIVLDSTDPSISFVSPTDADGSYVNRNYSYVNVSVSDTNPGSAFMDWNGSLLGWWRFNDANDFTDYSIYSNNATNYATTYTSAGYLGGAREFNGDYSQTNTRITAPDVSLYNTTGEFTVEAWVYPLSNGTTQGRIAVSKYKYHGYASNDTGWYLGTVWVGNVLSFQVYNGLGQSNTVSDSTFFINKLNGWHHVVGVYRPSTYLRLYVDGSLVQESTSSIISSVGYNATGPLTIGRRSGDAQSHWNGSIDEVRIWNRALSAEEINASYDAGAYRLYHNFTNLADGNYTYVAYVQDRAGNVNSTEIRGLAIGPLLCGALSSPNTIYTMRINASINGATCFTVSAANVTLDCAGYSIVGNNSASTYGVYTNQFNTTIQNCNISTFSNAIYLSGASSNYVTDVNLSCTNGGSCLGIVSGSRNTIINDLNSVSTVGNGCYIGGSTNITLQNSICNNSVSGTKYGIYNTASSNNTNIINTTAYSAAGYAIYIDGGAGVTIDCRGRPIIGTNVTGTYGVYSTQSATTVQNCNISKYDIAINLNNAASPIVNNTVITADLTTSSAIILAGTTSNAIINNVTARTNAASGNPYCVWLSGGSSSGSNIISSSQIYSAASTAVYVSSGASNTILRDNNLTSSGREALSISLNGNSAQVIGNTISTTGGSNGAMLMRSMIGSLFANNTFTTSGSVPAVSMLSNTINNNNTFYNNTFSAPGKTLVFINANSSGNVFYWNNFTATTGLYVNDSNGSNYYNTSIAGQAAGNIWANVANGSVSVIGIVSSPLAGLYYGSKGSGYPYNASNSLGMLTGSNTVDYAPLTPYTNDAPTITGSRISPTSPNATSTLQGFCTATDADDANVNYYYKWYLNGAINTSGTTTSYTEGVELNVANISSSLLAVGQNWTLSCLATDGVDNSSWLNSSTATVVDIVPPAISFVSPTDDNNSDVPRNWTYINVSVTDTNLGSAFIDWNRSLVGWWRFNNEAGENSTFFKDYSSWSNNCTCSGASCPIYAASGRLGGAYIYDGSNDYFSCGNPSVSLTGDLTISAWVYTSLSAREEIVWKNFNNEFDFGIEPTGGFNWWQGNGTWQGTVGVGAGAVPANTWTHVVAVRNSSSNAVSFYANGLYKGQYTFTYAVAGSSSPIVIGSRTGPQAFNGTIDDLQIFSRMLSPEEINASYNVGSYRLYHNFTNLADGNYTFAAYAQDIAGNVNSTENRAITVDTAASTISFVNPTDPNGSYVSRNWSYVNASIGGTNVQSAFIDWNRSLVTWYRLNGESGENGTFFRDWSSNQNNATCVGLACPVAITSGKLGGAYAFDGNATYLHSTSLKVNLSTSFTVMAWVKSSNFSKGMYVLEVLYGEPMLQTGACGASVTMRNQTDTGWLTYSGSCIALNNDQWNFIAATYDTDDTVKVYQNGILKGTGTHPGFMGGYPAAPQFDVGGRSTVWFNGSIDDVLVFSRALSSEEINATYNAGTYRLYHNFTNLTDSTYNYTAYVQDTAGNVGSTGSYNVTVDTAAPVVSLISPSNNTVSNSSTQNFSCNITDNLLLLNLTLSIWNSSGTLVYNSTNSIAGTLNTSTWSYTLPYANSFRWMCYGYDKAGNAARTGNYTITYNPVPAKISLLAPANGNVTVHERLPTFNWTASTDNDLAYYQINITSSTACQNVFSNVTNSTPYFVPTAELCIKTDNGGNTNYNWTVRACDSLTCSPWSDTWNFTIEPWVIITLVNSSVNFGAMVTGQTKDTTSGVPGPFVLRNDGNVKASMINISANQSLWISPAGSLGKRYMQVMAGNVSAEPGSFNQSSSVMSWVNLTANLSLISQLDYNDSRDSAYVHMKVEVPGDEPGGTKQGYITFYWIQSP